MTPNRGKAFCGFDPTGAYANYNRANGIATGVGFDGYG
jgi:hypothetical protein